MNFLQLVFKESGIPISRNIFQWLLPCKARNRVGDKNRLYENQWYENSRKFVVICWYSSLFIFIFNRIKIFRYSYIVVLPLNSRWIAVELIFVIEYWIFHWMLNFPLNWFLLLNIALNVEFSVEWIFVKWIFVRGD